MPNSVPVPDTNGGHYESLQFQLKQLDAEVGNLEARLTPVLPYGFSSTSELSVDSSSPIEAQVIVASEIRDRVLRLAEGVTL